MLVSGCRWGCCAAAKVMLEGAARGVRNVPNSCCKGASEGCCCTLLLLQGAAVRVACPLWSWPAGAAAGCCFKVLQLKWCVRFGVGMFLARMLLSDFSLRSSRRRRAWRVVAKKRFMLFKTQVLILQVYQGSDLGSSWFGHDSGTHFFWIHEALLLESLFPTVNLQRLLLNGCNGARPAKRPWTGPEYEEYEDLNAHLWFISGPAGVSSGCSSSDVPLAQLRLGYCSSSTDFWFGWIWLPASQPATAGVILLITLISLIRQHRKHVNLDFS